MCDVCRQAIACGLTEIAFTEHVDLMPADAGYGHFRPGAFMAEVNRCRTCFGDQLRILAGVEVGEPHRFPAEVKALLESYPFDLVIGSLHWVGEEPIFLPPAYYDRRPPAQAFGDYFAELAVLCQAGGFDVLGHLDVIKRYCPDPAYEVWQYEQAIRLALQALVEHGIALEINTSTLCRLLAQSSPDETVVRWYREMGGERLTFGSDAHAPERLTAGWEHAVRLARQTGFSHWTSFRGRSPHDLPLENGL
jgi:histidinol-phosphatase (PHP family)